MAGKYDALATAIIKDVGGRENINNLIHCVTRLRFYLNDHDKADSAAINQLDGVMGTQYQGGQYQVVIGPAVADVYDAVMAQLGNLGTAGNDGGQTTAKSASSEAAPAPEDPADKQGWLNQLMGVIGGIFTPIMGAIAGAGMFKGILIGLTYYHVLAATSQTYMVLNIIADSTFYFLPFLLASSAAKRFKTNEYISLAIAGALMYPTIINLATNPANKLTSLSFFGFPVRIVNYSSSVIPILLAVWALSWVYPRIDKHLPSAIKMIFTPLLSLLIMIPVTLVVLGPLGSYLGIWVGAGIKWLFNTMPLVAGIVLGASRPILVMTGMHYAITPIILQNISQFGYDFINPVNFMSTMGQAGAVLAVFFMMKKNRKMKELAGAATFSALMGVTEPALYGVLIKLKRPLIGAMIGGGVAGGLVGVLGGRAYALVLPSLISIPIYFGPKLMVVLIGAVLAFVVGFIATWVLGLAKDADQASDAAPALATAAAGVAPVANATVEHATPTGGTTAKPEVKKIPAGQISQVASPVAGEVRALDSIDDQVFATGMMGAGIAIEPADDNFISPVDGVVTVAYETGHALGLLADDGAEVLIHIGMDTVQLNGEGFTQLVKQGDHLKKGDPLVKVDRALIKQKGYTLTTPVIITNSKDAQSVTPQVKPGEKVAAAQALLEVKF